MEQAPLQPTRLHPTSQILEQVLEQLPSHTLHLLLADKSNGFDINTVAAEKGNTFFEWFLEELAARNNLSHNKNHQLCDCFCTS